MLIKKCEDVEVAKVFQIASSHTHDMMVKSTYWQVMKDTGKLEVLVGTVTELVTGNQV